MNKFLQELEAKFGPIDDGTLEEIDQMTAEDPFHPRLNKRIQQLWQNTANNLRMDRKAAEHREYHVRLIESSLWEEFPHLHTSVRAIAEVAFDALRNDGVVFARMGSWDWDDEDE